MCASSCRSCSATQHKEFEARGYTELPSPGGFSLRFPYDGNIGIRILPEHQQILVDGGRFGAISGSGQCSRQFEARHWPNRVVQCDSRVIQNLPKLCRGLAMAAHPGISEATNVD